MVKVALGEGTAAPQRVGAVTLQAGENYLYSSGLHLDAGYALFGTYTSPGRVIKVALGAEDALPTRVGAVELSGGEDLLGSVLIDPDSGRAYFGTLTSPGRIVGVGMGAPEAAPTRLGAVTLDSGVDNLYGAAFNPQTGTALFSSFAPFSALSRVMVSQTGLIKLTRFTLPETAQIQRAAFYSHLPSGNVRLALYREVSEGVRALVWQSGSQSNPVAGGFVEIPISNGSPSQLSLEPGTYYFAWQVDTTANVPSRSTGEEGEGSYLISAYGDFPSQLNSESAVTRWTPTDEVWTGYISYNEVSGSDPIWLRVGAQE